MKANDIGSEVVTNLADAPDWVDMTRNYLGFALARHAEATGQILDPEDQLRETVAQTDMHLGPEGRFVVARASGGEVVGIVLLHRLANGRGEIKRLFVEPKARRLGIARRLTERLEAEAREMGLLALHLDTCSGLREAIAFYGTLGIRKTAFDPSSLQDPEIARHLVIMEKSLQPA